MWSVTIPSARPHSIPTGALPHLPPWSRGHRLRRSTFGQEKLNEYSSNRNRPPLPPSPVPRPSPPLISPMRSQCHLSCAQLPTGRILWGLVAEASEVLNDSCKKDPQRTTSQTRNGISRPASGCAPLDLCTPAVCGAWGAAVDRSEGCCSTPPRMPCPGPLLSPRPAHQKG